MRFSDPAGAVRYMTRAERVGRTTEDPVLAAYAIADRGLLRSFEGELKAGLIDIEIGASRLETLARRRTVLQPNVIHWIQDMVASDGRSRGHSEPTPIDEVPTAMRWGAQVAWLAAAGQFERSRTLGERLVKEGRTVPGGVHVGLARCYAATGEPETAREVLAKAIDTVSHQANHVLVGHFVAEQLEMVELPFFADDIPARRRLQEIGENAWRQSTEALPSQIPPRASWTSVLLLEGEWDDAVQLARYETERGFAMRRLRALATQAAVATWQGDFERATDIILQILPLGSTTEPGDGPFYPAIDAQKLAIDIALQTGDLNAAGDWLDVYLRWLEVSGASGLEADALLYQGRYERGLGNHKNGIQTLDRAIAVTSKPRRQPLVRLAALRERAEIQIDLGEVDEARRSLRTALDVANSCLALYETGRVEATLARCEAIAGNITVARDHVRSARAKFERLAARPALDSLTSMATTLRIDTPPTNTRSSEHRESEAPLNLTKREIEVLQLVAAGMSNREIASALDLSIRTVERHVSNIYDKIGVHNRVDATAFAIRTHLA